MQCSTISGVKNHAKHYHTNRQSSIKKYRVNEYIMQESKLLDYCYDLS